MRSTDRARIALRRAQFALGLLAVAIAIPVGVAAATLRPSPPATTVVTGPAIQEMWITGLLAGATTLLLCWTLLVVAGAVWRSRLASRDRRGWTRGWARVEPGWSGRKVQDSP